MIKNRANSFLNNFNLKQGEISNQSFDDIEKPWKEKVVALEKINEVLRGEINELQQEAQSTTEVLNQAKHRLQECKANKTKADNELNLKINDLKQELECSKAAKSKLEKTVKEIENKYIEESKLTSSSMVKNKEFELKISNQLQIIDSFEQISKTREAAIVSLNEKLQKNMNTYQIKHQEQRKANEQISNQKSELESKLTDKIKELEQSKKETASLKGNLTKMKNKNKESDEIIERIRNKINDHGL